MKIKIVIFCLFFYNFGFSQSLLDSLKKELVNIKEVKKKSSLYIDIAWEYMNQENDSALYYANLGYEFSKKNNYSFGMITNLEMKGMHLEYVNNDYSNAINSYYQAIDIANKTNDNYISALYMSLGVLFNQIDNTEKAKENYNLAISKARNLKQKEVLKLSQINLGIIYNSEGNTAKAIQIFKESLTIKHPNRTFDDATLLNLAKVYLKQHNPQLAHDLLLTSLKNIKNNNFYYHQNYSSFLDAKLELNALNGIDSLIDIVANFEKNTNTLKEKLSLLKSLSDAYKIKKNFNKSIHYKDQYILYSDSLFKKTNSESIFNAEQKYQSAKKQLIIDKNKSQQKSYYIIFGLLGFGLASLGYFYYLNRKKNFVLESQHKVITKTLAENETLLKETHHRVKNSLQMISSLLYLQSENIEDKKAAESVKDGQIRVKSMALIHQKLYQKNNLTGVEVSDYINDLGLSIFQSHNINNEDIALEINSDKMILDIDTITPIGIIINELIVNALKHAFDETIKHPKISIFLTKKQDSLLLQVADNGKGFNLGTKKEKSFGMKLIKSLSRKLKADLNITNKNGTLVELNIKRFSVK